FDIRVLQTAAEMGQISPDAQRHVYLLLLIGFGILISLFPFHTWAPEAYAAAPAPAAMLHAGVLKKFGLYGLLRLAIPMLPEGARHWATLLVVLLLANIIYVGLVTIAQRRLDWMLGYSSVMHMGYIFLGIASANILGATGAAVLMFAHGLSLTRLRRDGRTGQSDAVGRVCLRARSIRGHRAARFRQFRRRNHGCVRCFPKRIRLSAFSYFPVGHASRALGCRDLCCLYAARLSPHLFWQLSEV